MTLRYSLALVAGALLASPSRALAHCDTLDGPIVKDARGEKGRAYVAAYVAFMHYAERLLQTATPGAGDAELEPRAGQTRTELHRH
jgi:hypothetical protein